LGRVLTVRKQSLDIDACLSVKNLAWTDWHQHLAAIAALEGSIAVPKRGFRLIDFDIPLRLHDPGRHRSVPLERVVMRCAAQTHVVTGSSDRCITVPAILVSSPAAL
jgi:hypothetical protein